MVVGNFPGIVEKHCFIPLGINSYLKREMTGSDRRQLPLVLPVTAGKFQFVMMAAVASMITGKTADD